MKKIFIKILVILVSLLVVAVVVASLFIGRIAKGGIETVGSKVLQVQLKIDSATLSPVFGIGGVHGMVIGNPEGFKTSQAIKASSASMSIQPSTIFSKKVVIRSIHIKAPEITIEGNPFSNNLTKIRDNINEALGSEKSTRKYQIDDLLIENGKIHMGIVGDKTVPIPLPTIHIKDLGKGEDGFTAAELTSKLFQIVQQESMKAMAKENIENLGKQGADAINEAGNAIKNIFK